MTEALTPDRVLPLLRGGFGAPYLYVACCESTQQLLGEEHPHGAVAASDVQTAGRGRLGRSWQAPPGTALLMSILLRPLPERIPAELSLVAAHAVAETVEEAVGAETGVKWPNDVLLSGRKVAGILAEARPGAGVVLGIGLNVNQTTAELPERPQFEAGSLLVFDGVYRDRALLLATLLERLELAYARWARDGLSPLVPYLARRDALRGLRVVVDEVSGTAAGIAESGELVLETPQGRRLVVSGEATVR